LKAGAAYVPVDPEYPTERIGYMLRDSQAQVLLTQKRLQQRLLAAAQVVDDGETSNGCEGAGTEKADTEDADRKVASEALSGMGEVLLLDEESTYVERPEGNISRKETGQKSSNLAYVIYTSGSTGLPKGVMVEHRSVVNRLVWMQDEYGLTEADTVLQKTSIGFDVSVWEIFSTLQSGARLVMAIPGGHRDVQYLEEVIEANGVTVLNFVPSMLRAFLEQTRKGQFSSVRQIMCAGEELPPSLQSRCTRLLPKASLDNIYGPTEAGITFWKCDPIQKLARIPIGRPISNTRIYIVGSGSDITPVGVAGEICIGGDEVARGYLNRLELTAERFIPDPFSDEPDARMYRTGDLGYWRADGLIEFVGRNDFQVKIRGFRIELGEIEARLAKSPHVRDAVVVAKEDQLGDKRLVAYWVAREEQSEEALPDVERLRDHLKAELPEYMVPSAFVRLETMPLNTSGKVDRKALPAPDAEALVRHEYEAPQGPVEEVLAGIWQELLGVERVGRHDSFFDLGGHSLLAVQLMGRMRRELVQEVALKDFFAAPTIAEVAGSLAQADEALTAPVERADRTKELALSWAQQRLWFLEQLEDLGAAYHIPAVLRLQGELDKG
ncbi:amino acid adenylation domain-containing protein, partial [Lautropia dentalis]